MVVMGEKLGMDSRIGQSACYRLGLEPFFLGAMALSNAVVDYVKGYNIHGLPTESVWVAYVDLRKKRTCHVYLISIVRST
jgi:hypothetical protein